MNRLGLLQEWSIAWLLLLKFTLRHWLAAKWSYLLILLIVAVGIGSLNGIRQASRAATANFGLFNEAVSGRSDFLIEASAGPLDSKQLLSLSSLSHSSDWHLFPVVGSQCDSEPIRTDHCTRMNDDTVTKLDSVPEGHIGVKAAVFAERAIGLKD